MLARIRRRLTYANVMATIAVFVALGTGGAYATHEVILSSDIQDGEVKSVDIEDLGIQTADIGQNQVTSPKLKDGAIKIQDLGPNNTDSSKVVDNSLTGADINETSLDLAFDQIVIQRHEFDTTAGYFNTTTDWEVLEGGGAALKFDPMNSVINMETQESPFTAGSVVVRGRRAASVNDGTLTFTTRMLDAYAETPSVYGDRQPRGLANGTSRNNAIEFVNTTPGPTRVACRTVSDGAVTETDVDIGQSVREPAVYQIVAAPTTARFYVNGALVCTHTTNIPTAPLNIYFGTSDGGFGNVPVLIDWVSFGRRG